MTLEQPELPPSEIESRPLLTAGSEPGRHPRRALWAIVIVLIAAAAWLLFHGSGERGSKSAAAKGKSPAPRAIPVVAVPAVVGDIGVYVDGLGTVTALNTVTIHSCRRTAPRRRVPGRADRSQRRSPRDRSASVRGPADGGRAEGQDEAACRTRGRSQRYRCGGPGRRAPPAARRRRRCAPGRGRREGDRQVDAAKLNLTYSRITAPITGGGARLGTRATSSTRAIAAGSSSSPSSSRSRSFTYRDSFLRSSRRCGGRKLVVEANDRDMKKRLASGTLGRRQPDRHHHGDGEAQGRVRKRRRRSLCESVRQRAAPRPDSRQRPARPRGGDPAQSPVDLRVGRGVRLVRRDAQRRGPAHRRRPGGDHRARQTRRAAGGGRRRQAAAGLEGRRISAGRAGAAVPARGKTVEHRRTASDR
jgi:hypothetical protein